jgi:hypothetical protein
VPTGVCFWHRRELRSAPSDVCWLRLNLPIAGRAPTAPPLSSARIEFAKDVSCGVLSGFGQPPPSRPSTIAD